MPVRVWLVWPALRIINIYYGWHMGGGLQSTLSIKNILMGWIGRSLQGGGYQIIIIGFTLQLFWALQYVNYNKINLLIDEKLKKKRNVIITIDSYFMIIFWLISISMRKWIFICTHNGVVYLHWKWMLKNANQNVISPRESHINNRNTTVVSTPHWHTFSPNDIGLSHPS